MKSIEVILPTGFKAGEKWYNNAGLRLLNGGDEEVLRKESLVLFPAERITKILTRCLTNLGPKSAPDNNDVRSLTVGDRDALLFHLRRLTYGGKIQAVLTCPQSGCGEKMDLELKVDDLLVPSNQTPKETYETEIHGDAAVYTVKFRLPTGADQEAVAPSAQFDHKTASNLLLQRCVKEIKKSGTQIDIETDLPGDLAESVSQKMAELDPQAEILLNLTCPACKQSFLAYFDIGDYFFKELMANSQNLYREVHVLALHYHWSEKDILNMTRSKRQIYLKLLADALYPEQNL